MPLEFNRSDLLEDISNRELTAIAARIVHAGDPDPVASAIARAQGTVERYTARYALESNTEKGFIRDLALYFLSSRVLDGAPNRQLAYDQAMTELRDIRDGKYPNLPLDGSEQLDLPNLGAWGSGGEEENAEC